MRAPLDAIKRAVIVHPWRMGGRVSRNGSITLPLNLLR